MVVVKSALYYSVKMRFGLGCGDGYVLESRVDDVTRALVMWNVSSSELCIAQARIEQWFCVGLLWSSVQGLRPT